MMGRVKIVAPPPKRYFNEGCAGTRLDNQVLKKLSRARLLADREDAEVPRRVREPHIISHMPDSFEPMNFDFLLSMLPRDCWPPRDPPACS